MRTTSLNLNIFLRVLIIITPILWSSCTDLNSLSDEAEVKSVHVAEHSPSSIILESAVIDNEKREITIPVVFGKYQFPMSLKLDINAPNSQPLGVDFNSTVLFNSIESEIDFYLRSESGLVHPWKIKLLENALPEGNLVQRFDVLSHTPKDAVLSYRTDIDVAQGQIKLMLASAIYPLTIESDIKVSSDALLGGITSGDNIVFENAESQYTFTVTSASGNIKEWVISIVECVELPSTATRQELNGVDFNNLIVQVVENSNNIALVNRSWDVRTGVLLLQLKDTLSNGDVFPATLDFNSFTVSTNSEVLGLPLDNRLTFTQDDSEQIVYIIDRINATKRTWRPQVEKYIDTQANIISISGEKSGSFPLGLSIDGFNVYPNDKKVVLVTSALFTSTLKVNVTSLIVNSTAKVIDQPDQLSFTSSDATNVITVESESGERVPWTILTKSRNAFKSDRAEIISIDLIQYESKTNKIRLGTYPIIDQNRREVTLTVEEGAWDFPLSIRSAISTSPFSIIKPANEGDRFDGSGFVTFETSRDVVDLNIIAENGDVVPWKIILKTSGVLNNEANLSAITFSEEPSNMQIADEYFIDNDNREFIFQIASGLDNFPLIIKPDYQVSQGAFTDIPNRFPLYFASIGSTNRVKVTSEDGTNTTEWVIKLIYTPQIDNSGFERWENDTKLSPGSNSWTSANNTFVTGTRRSSEATEGNSAIQMSTSKVDNIFAKEIASGSAFLGQFKFNIAQASTPKLMTWFGTPFYTRPNRLIVDLNYNRGDVVEQSADGKFTVLPGRVDSASVIIEIIRYSGDPDVEMEYHLDPTPDVEVLGRGELIFTNTQGWVTANIDLEYTNTSSEPTHISISAASSARGDSFIGANGSRLLMDNLKLIYPQTPSGSNIVSKRRR
ncbi:MAG: PCMD domain-containing protein [Bacteroidales bacterium]